MQPPQHAREAVAGYIPLINAADTTTGCTAFHNACNFGHAECVKLLEQKGCDTSTLPIVNVPCSIALFPGYGVGYVQSCTPQCSYLISSWSLFPMGVFECFLRLV